MSRRPRQPVLLALAKLDERKSRLVELRYFVASLPTKSPRYSVSAPAPPIANGRSRVPWLFRVLSS
jgi:hypothetical protein